MLTIKFDLLDLKPGDTFLDAGTGFGRHAFEAARRGARVVALDYAEHEVAITRATFAAMYEAGELDPQSFTGVVRGDATCLPFNDATFDCIVTSEVLEHIDDDTSALREIVRVLRPGGRLAATVPSWFPEKINWALSDEYHAPFVKGGHLRIYRSSELRSKITAAGLVFRDSHKAHGLHSPYWWLRCAVGPQREDNKAVSLYKKFLEWDIVAAPPITRALDRALSPLIGKSLVVYATKPALELVEARS